MKIHASNLITALSLAILAQQEHEKKIGYTSDSAMLAGWKDARNALRVGEPVEIIGNTEH